MTFVIFHGAFGGPSENWFPWLKDELEASGHEVFVPKFPVEDYDQLTLSGPKTKTVNQNLHNWMAVFDELLLKLNGKELCFIGHSIAAVFILHAVIKHNLNLDSAIFVAPFLTKLNPKLWQFQVVNQTFYNDKFDFSKLKKLIPISYTVFSDNDPYVDIKYPLRFTKKMQSEKIIVKGGKHLGSNYKEFPLLLDLAKTRIS